MPRRDINDPPIFPGLTVPESGPDIESLGAEVFTYLTDSSEIQRVRTPVSKNSEIELRCVFVTRELSVVEQIEFRHGSGRLGNIAVNPQMVNCSVTAPRGLEFSPIVSIERTSIYVAKFVVVRPGAWRYQFEGHGGWTGSHTRIFSVK